MKSVQFQDLDNQNITVQLSSLASQEAYRIYVDEGKTVTELQSCIHLNRFQVLILINALEDLMQCE